MGWRKIESVAVSGCIDGGRCELVYELGCPACVYGNAVTNGHVDFNWDWVGCRPRDYALLQSD